MKHLPMTRRKDHVLPIRPPHERSGDQRSGSAFDVWLQRGLHQLFDGVAREPIPPALLRLIEEERGEVVGTPAAAVSPASEVSALGKSEEKT